MSHLRGGSEYGRWRTRDWGIFACCSFIETHEKDRQRSHIQNTTACLSRVHTMASSFLLSCTYHGSTSRPTFDLFPVRSFPALALAAFGSCQPQHHSEHSQAPASHLASPIPSLCRCLLSAPSLISPHLSQASPPPPTTTLRALLRPSRHHHHRPRALIHVHHQPPFAQSPQQKRWQGTSCTLLLDTSGPTPPVRSRCTTQQRHHPLHSSSAPTRIAHHVIEQQQCCRRALPRRQEDRRGQLRRYLRGDQLAQQHSGRYKVRAEKE